MKAAVVRSFDQPLSIEDLPIPEPGAAQVLVRIETCGLCHTDDLVDRGVPAATAAANGRVHSAIGTP